MPKVILICGKICSGKSTYAETLRRQRKGVLLSVDEIMLSIFGQHCGELHDEYAQRTKDFLFAKSIELIESGIDVILDWGPWTKEGRADAKAYFTARNIECECHYIDISDELWQERIHKRNRAVLAGETLAYYVDDNLAAKFAARFERPSREEIDVWVDSTNP